MAGNSTEIRISSNALILLGDEPISDYNGAGAGSVSSSNLFRPTYISLLSSYPWGFARKYKKLARLSEAPIDGYQYKFALPPEMLRLVDCSSSRFDLMGGNLLSDEQEVTIDYVADVAVDLAPEYFSTALELLLAEKLAVPVTGDLDKASYYKREAGLYIKKARFLDSTQTPTIAPKSPQMAIRNS